MNRLSPGCPSSTRLVFNGKNEFGSGGGGAPSADRHASVLHVESVRTYASSASEKFWLTRGAMLVRSYGSQET